LFSFPAAASDFSQDGGTKTIKQKIIKPLEEKSAAEPPKNFADKFFSHIVIPLKKGPLLLLPVVDSSRDLGPNYGLMPIWAMRDEKRHAIGSVLAPSVNYNQYLHTTLTYRHYFFPDDVQLWVARASYSQKVQREIFLRYNNPLFMGTRFRINAEARSWINGKASYYGEGIHTAYKDRATFALHTTGEEFTVSCPLPANFYFDFTHSFYRYKVSDGPVPTSPQLSSLYPETYAATSGGKNISKHRFALFYDDTDHPAIPRLGTYASLSADYSSKILGSDYNYHIYSAELKHYFNFKGEGKYVTAVHGLIQDLKGGHNVPFYAQPTLGESTGLRAVGDGRYIGGGKVVLSAEERITVTKLPVMNFFSEFEITPFIDTGMVFGTLSEIRAKDFLFGPGFALRIVIKPQVVATADFAFGKESSNIIIHVGYPF